MNRPEFLNLEKGIDEASAISSIQRTAKPRVKPQVLTRMPSKWNTYCWWECKNGTATFEKKFGDLIKFSIYLPGKSHGWRSLVGCSPWGHWGSDTTEQLHFHFSLSCIGEGNGNPLQCSCLENPRDGGAWWAAVYGVAQSRTRLKRLSSRSSSSIYLLYDLVIHS